MMKSKLNKLIDSHLLFSGFYTFFIVSLFSVSSFFFLSLVGEVEKW